MASVESDQAYWEARGQRPVACTRGGSCWVRNERFSFVRSLNDIGPPDERERRILFWQRFTPAIGYVVEPAGGDANAVLYVCADHAYDVDRLPKKSRRDVRRGLRSVEVRRLGFDELARIGHPALVDTRARNRAGAPAQAEFAADCRLRGRFACQEAWAAFAGADLCAWMTTHRVGDAMDLGAVAMRWETRHLCATYALVYEVTRRALTENGVSRVSYGLSSLQEESRVASLHQFKTWLGFEARPVRRMFELHPLVTPLRQPWALDLAAGLLSHAPQTRGIRKLRGALHLMRPRIR